MIATAFKQWHFTDSLEYYLIYFNQTSTFLGYIFYGTDELDELQNISLYLNKLT